MPRYEFLVLLETEGVNPEHAKQTVMALLDTLTPGAFAESQRPIIAESHRLLVGLAKVSYQLEDEARPIDAEQSPR